MNSFFFAINNQYLLCAVPAQGEVFSYISFVGSRTHGRGTFCSRKKYPKTRRGVPPIPQFYGGVQSASIKFGTFLPLNYVFTSDLWRVYRRCFGCRPRRHKLRIPHPAASGRLRSLRCASFFLGNSAGLPRSGPFGADLVSHRTFNNAGGIPKGASPLCVVVGEGYIGEGPHQKGPAPMRPFGYFSGEGKVSRGSGAEPPQGFGKKHVSFPPARRYANQPCIGAMRWPSAIWRERRDAVSANQ